MPEESIFVQVEDGRDGVAKLVGVAGKSAEVEYLESPAGPVIRRLRLPPKTALREVELSPQTRVFWFDPSKNSWRAGRVEVGLISAKALGTNEDHYQVRFPNRVDARIPISELHVRWSHPIAEPTDYLAARVTDTPRFFDGRTRFVRFLAAQRAAFGGLSGLASSGIELLEHQVDIVRRVLADPVQRYLLADEVGLGKTIEAGILIRQHVIDEPDNARVLVIAPPHLVPQWRNELESKFFLSTDSVVAVVSDEDLRDVIDHGDAWSMLVVDEAHKPALNAFASEASQRLVYEAIRSLAVKVPRLLLLSGTPVLKQEDGFLAMLHLLDPAGYPLEDRLAFKARVDARQAIAEALLDLTDDASEYFAADAIDRLSGFFEQDTRLEDLCSRVRKQLPLVTNTPERVTAIRALRVHLGETYRLHRRLLRTRRDDPRVQAYLPRRTGVTIIEHEDEARQEAFDLLESWRLGLPSTSVDQKDEHEALFFGWVAAAMSHPVVLLRAIDERLASLRSSRRTLPAFDGEERMLVERRVLLANAAKNDLRATRLAAWLRSANDVKKAVVFVDDREVADSVADVLRGSLGPQGIVRYDGTQQAVRKFEERRELTVLVCDRSAEEGLNLQRYGAVVIHFDLPLESTRLEQRIGRVDRLEARGQMRNVALFTTCPYENEWFTCVRNAIRVFERSIAPLQYVLLESTSRIRSHLITDGPSAIDQEAAEFLDSDRGLDAELRRIRAQEAIDAVEGDAEVEAAFFQALCEADETSEVEGERALNAWTVDQLHFRCQRAEPHVIQYVHDLRRPTLLPLFDTYRLFRQCIERSARAGRDRSTLPMQPATFGRAISEKKHVGLMRIGHPFVNAMEALVRSDDRGVAFAMWRYIPRSTRIPRLFVRFDFVVDADLGTLPVAFAQQLSLASLRRRVDQAFPVQYRTVWLNGDLQPVSQPRVLEALERPYRKEPHPDGSRDVNLRSERWERVDMLVSVPDWSDLCHRARRAAEAIVRGDSTLVEDCHRYATATLDAANRVDESLRSRFARLAGATRVAEERAAAIELEIGRCLARGIERPSLRVDSTGVVFLASQPLDVA